MMTDTEIVDKLIELHSPTPIPEGKTWMGARRDHPEDAPCAGCSTGDPFLDPFWPCETREIINEGRSQ